MYDAVVVGSGPAGIATVGNIIDCNDLARILWVDPEFRGGKITKKYLDVSSNTKVSVFLQFVHAIEPFREIVRSTPGPNAVTALECLDGNAGCELSYASGMLLMLTEGLRRLPNVDTCVGTVVEANLDTQTSLWSIQTQDQDSPTTQVYARKLILCTGSSPSIRACGPPGLELKQVHLDTALDRPSLREDLATADKATVAVVGTSHSAIVVLMNLYELASTSHPQLRVKWFTRRPLAYAKQMDGWILRDNTGLKGRSASFAREHLEDDRLKQSPVGEVIEKIDCATGEDDAYRSRLPACTHLVQAIGYTADPVPCLQADGQPLGKLLYDNCTGLFQDAQGSRIPGLCGAGIAFPEKVVDRAGNTEYAVGFWKFMNYLRRVVPAHWDVTTIKE